MAKDGGTVKRARKISSTGMYLYSVHFNTTPMKTAVVILLFCFSLAPGFAQEVSFNAMDTLKKGLEFAYDNQWDQANALYLKVIRHSMENPGVIEAAHMDAYRRLGIDMKAEGKEDSMRLLLFKSSDLYAQHPLDTFAESAIDNFNQMVAFYGRRNKVDSAMAMCDKGEAFALENKMKPSATYATIYTNRSFGFQIKGQFANAFEAAERAVQITRSTPEMSNVEKSISYLQYAHSLTRAGLCSKAQRYLDTCLLILRQDTIPDAERVADALIRKASCYMENGLHIQKMTYLEEAKAVLDRHKDPRDPKFAYLYHFYASHFREFQDYERALSYFFKIVDILEENIAVSEHADVRNNRLDLGTAHGNIGDIMVTLGNYDEAAFHYQKSLDIDLVDVGETGETMHSYMNFGNLYFAQGDIANGELYYQKAVNIAEKFHGIGHRETILLYSEIGSEYFARGDYVKAHAYYQLANAGMPPDMANAVKSTISYNLGRCAAVLDSTIVAEQYLRQSLTLIDIDPDNVGDVPAGSESFAIEALKRLGDLREDPDDALRYLLPAEIVLQRLLRESIISEQAQMRYTDQASGLYEGIQKALVQKGDLTAALQYCDRSKSQLLRQRWVEKAAMHEMQVPTNLLERKLSLEYERHKHLGSTDEVSVRQAKIFEIDKEIDAIHARMASEYPHYYDFLNNHTHTIPAETSEGEIIVSYFMGLDKLYMYVQEGTEVNVFTSDPAEIYDQATALHELLNSGNTSATQQLEELCVSLGMALLQPLPSHSKDAGTLRLSIISDGVLSMVPFEILYIPGTDLRVIEQCAVRYLTNLDSRSTDSGRSARKMFAGFAATYQALSVEDTLQDADLAMLVRSGSYPLPGAIGEVNEIADLLGGDRYLSSEASERAFYQFGSSYKILHLSMHAVPDIGDPGLSRLLFTNTGDSLYDDQLSAAEVQALQLNSDLAVLSACQTNVGKIHRGEGVLSLSRAFAMAGVPSTVTSLWKVPDASSKDIMVRFYTYLKQGMAKDAALRQSKLDYLNDAKYDAQKHPVHWAGFVVTGDISPIRQQSFLVFWLLGGAGVLALLALARRRARA